jgi:hypothetical protein
VLFRLERRKTAETLFYTSHAGLRDTPHRGWRFCFNVIARDTANKLIMRWHLVLETHHGTVSCSFCFRTSAVPDMASFGCVFESANEQLQDTWSNGRAFWKQQDSQPLHSTRRVSFWIRTNLGVVRRQHPETSKVFIHAPGCVRTSTTAARPGGAARPSADRPSFRL